MTFILSLLLLPLFFFSGYFTAFPLFADSNQEKKGLADFFIISFCGIVILTLLSVILRAAGIGEIFVFILPVISAFIFRKKISLPSFAINRNLVIHLGVFGILNFNLFLQGFRMGIGEFASEFYNVDSAAYLGLLQGVINSHTYPPSNLEILGASFKYHYGSLVFANLVSKFTMLKAHSSLFIVVAGFTALAFYSTVYKVSRQIINADGYLLPVASTIIIILLSNFSINSFSLVRTYHLIFKIGYFGKEFPMISSYTAQCISAVCVYLLMNLLNTRKVLLLIILATSVVFFKLPYYPVILSGSCLFLLFLIFSEKQKSLYWAFPALLFLGGLWLYFFSFGNNFSDLTSRGTNKISISINRPFIKNILSSYVLLIFPFVLFFIKKFEVKTYCLAACFLMVTFMAGLFIKVDNSDYLQIFQNSFFILLLLLVPLSFAHFKEFPMALRSLTLVNWVAPSLLILSSLFYYSYILFFHKNKAHEYCDNRQIGEALKSIPTHFTLLVSNDLRYPAENYVRDDKQFQLSALFGHQCLGSSKYFITKEAEGNYLTSLSVERMLQEPQWNDSLKTIFNEKKIAHVLVNENYNHPNSIPLKKIFANKAYSVYETKAE